MSLDEALKQLAREREDKAETHLSEMWLDPPELVGKGLRAYLADQVDRRRIKRTNEKMIQINKPGAGLDKLLCPETAFTSGSRLDFWIAGKSTQRGWLMQEFEFHLRLPDERLIDMVRIHLLSARSHKPWQIPRCHLHIGSSEAHVPFPLMHPLLILQMLCEHLEPDLGEKPIDD